MPLTEAPARPVSAVVERLYAQSIPLGSKPLGWERFDVVANSSRLDLRLGPDGLLYAREALDSGHSNYFRIQRGCDRLDS